MIEAKPLPYSLTDLEPYYDSKTLDLHYNVLYKGYVGNLNKTFDKLDKARRENNFENIKCLEKDLSFFGCAVILHEDFFNNLAPPRKEKSLLAELRNRIDSDFGDFESFYNQLNSAMLNIEGVGWTIFGYNHSLNKLVILQCEKHQELAFWNTTPLLVLDIWEHSYYLQYNTDKATYVKNLWSIINWDMVNSRFKNLNLK